MPNNIPASSKAAHLTRFWTRPANAPIAKLAFMLTAAGAARDAYSSTNEASGTGYVAGGYTVSGLTAAVAGTKGVQDATDVSCGTVTLSFQYADLYDDANSPKQVQVTYDFGAQTFTAVPLTIEWPTPDATNGMFRIA